MRVPPAQNGPSSLANAFERSRAARQQRVEAWGRRVVQRLADLGLEVDACVVDARRAASLRAAFAPDGRLALSLEPDRIEVALELPVADLRAVRTLLADPGRSLELTTALEALPEQFTMGPVGGAVAPPASFASSDALRPLLDELERDDREMWIGWTLPREIATAHTEGLDDQLEDAVVALGEVLALVSRAPQAPAARPKHDRHDDHGRLDDDRQGTKRRARARSRDRDPDRDHGRDQDLDRERDRDHDVETERLHRPGNARPRLRAGLRRRPAGASVDPRAPIEKGSRVRVLDGAFAGKVGVVQELDGKGGARVMLGLLAVRVDAKDLVAVTDAPQRVRLSSSHRRPLPVRS
ncbi:MAG TPA: KOW motif-containing protein [Polyangiaceae bacterium]